MPSSTSSSERRGETPPLHPVDGPRRTLVFALILAGLALGAIEVFWRSHGHSPSVVDDESLWAYHRSRVYESGERRSLALLGASRMLLDVSLDDLQTAFPGHRMVQLAIHGAHPLATLEDLAHDQSFRGDVICSIVAQGFEVGVPRTMQRGHVEFYHQEWGTADSLERFLSNQVQGRFAMVKPSNSLLKTVQHWWEHREVPENHYTTTLSDRSVGADFDLVTDIERLRKSRVSFMRRDYAKHPPSRPDAWLEATQTVEKWVHKIQERGGQVCFVRFPTAGEHYALDSRAYPRERYWDRFAEQTRAITLHFEDDPVLRSFDLPDTSHLHERDSKAFTLALADALIRRGFHSSGASGTALAKEREEEPVLRDKTGS